MPPTSRDITPGWAERLATPPGLQPQYFRAVEFPQSLLLLLLLVFAQSVLLFEGKLLDGATKWSEDASICKVYRNDQEQGVWVIRYFLVAEKCVINIV